MRHPCSTKRLAMTKLLLLGAAVLCWPAITHGQSGTTKSDKAKSGSATKQAQSFSPGIKVGTKLPAISLKNQTGETVSVQSMLQTGPVALVVFRSAEW